MSSSCSGPVFAITHRVSCQRRRNEKTRRQPESQGWPCWRSVDLQEASAASATASSSASPWSSPILSSSTAAASNLGRDCGRTSSGQTPQPLPRFWGFKFQDVKRRVSRFQTSGARVSGCVRVEFRGFDSRGSGFGAQGLKFRDWGLSFGAWGSRAVNLRVLGIGDFRVFVPGSIRPRVILLVGPVHLVVECPSGRVGPYRSVVGTWQRVRRAKGGGIGVIATLVQYRALHSEYRTLHSECVGGWEYTMPYANTGQCVASA
eukprot:1372238-Rhodomonas_salina.1